MRYSFTRHPRTRNNAILSRARTFLRFGWLKEKNAFPRASLSVADGHSRFYFAARTGKEENSFSPALARSRSFAVFVSQLRMHDAIVFAFLFFFVLITSDPLEAACLWQTRF